jgi:hypothetical protein
MFSCSEKVSQRRDFPEARRKAPGSFSRGLGLVYTQRRRRTKLAPQGLLGRPVEGMIQVVFLAQRCRIVSRGVNFLHQNRM